MKFHYHFSNLLGTVYRQGPLHFTPDGNTLLSPVGNKLSLFDLRSHKSETLPIETRFNLTQVCLSPDGVTVLAADDQGHVHLISLKSRSVLHTLRTNRDVHHLGFSPDGAYFTLCKESHVMVYKAPGRHTREYDPFSLARVLKGAYDDTTCVTWSGCSRVVAVGSKDSSVRLYSLEQPWTHTLGGHTEAVVGVFFEDKRSLACYSVSREGMLAVWENSCEWEEMVEALKKKALKKKMKKEDNPEEEDDLPDQDEAAKEVSAGESTSSDKVSRLYYRRLARHYLKDHLPQEERRGADLTAVDFHAPSHLLVAGFSTGAFFLFELPDATLLHSLSISEQEISSVRLNPAGDWIAFGCAGAGQLLVWEWQSETYVMKQQGHFNDLAALAYAPDGQHMATGGQDGKVKIWHSGTGFTTVTFREHTSAVSAVAFTPNGRVVLSASLDGTVRAFDMTRYRNFRTFTSPRPAQFGCLSVDASGELVAAGGTDTYEIYLWSLQTGRLLEVISGHEGPVSALAFCPSPSSSSLASVSWDKTLRIWNALAVSSSSESIVLGSDATAVAFRPDGQQVAVATLNGQIGFFDARTNAQVGSIDGRQDLGSGRSDQDLVTAKKTLQSKCFLTLCYSADGSCVLAGGQSKNICIYHVQERLLVKKFELTQNRSFDAMDDVISRKKMSEFGNLSLVEDRDDPGSRQAIKLPGTKKGDLSSRALRPEIQVARLEFSPTGRDFAAASTEGLLVYSLDTRLVFDPIDLSLDITPATIRQRVKDGDFGQALMMALRMNETDLLREVTEQIPHPDVDLLARDLPEDYVGRLIKFVGHELESTRHLHFYAVWCHSLLLHHGKWLRQKTVASKSAAAQLMPELNLLHKNLLRKSQDLAGVCEHNTYTMQFLLSTAERRRRKREEEEADVKMEGESGDESGEEEEEEEETENMDQDAFTSNWNSSSSDDE